MNYRSGIGYDIHAFAEGRPLVLGGVRIPHERGLSGHSDADVLTHAIADALLGAAGERDIGHHFPNTDPEWKDVDSQKLLARVAEILRDATYEIVNLDATLIAEEPMINPHIMEMRKVLAETLGIQTDQVGLKATTNEGLGFVGRREGIAALAVAGIQKSSY